LRARCRTNIKEQNYSSAFTRKANCKAYVAQNLKLSTSVFFPMDARFLAAQGDILQERPSVIKSHTVWLIGELVAECVY
jgi:hypothetical protein